MNEDHCKADKHGSLATCIISGTQENTTWSSLTLNYIPVGLRQRPTADKLLGSQGKIP